MTMEEKIEIAYMTVSFITGMILAYIYPAVTRIAVHEYGHAKRYAEYTGGAAVIHLTRYAVIPGLVKKEAKKMKIEFRRDIREYLPEDPKTKGITQMPEPITEKQIKRVAMAGCLNGISQGFYNMFMVMFAELMIRIIFVKLFGMSKAVMGFQIIFCTLSLIWVIIESVSYFCSEKEGGDRYYRNHPEEWEPSEKIK